jgi:glycosyltransferase involved in cell wall biosynthesis
VVHLPVSRVAPDRWATAEHRWRVARELARAPADVSHSPALDPLRRSPRPWVQSVADVLPLTRPDPELAVERRRWKRWASRLRAADAVVTFSHHGATQATQHLGLDASRVHVIPLAPPPTMVPCPSRRDQDDEPYILYVGEYGPHKGFTEAAAVASGLAEIGLPHQLRMAGRLTPATRARAAAAVASGGAREGSGRVQLLDWVPDLAPLYQAAAVVIVTSRHEGFGLPALEAMACATPVVAFDNSATTEVVGAGGTLVPDGDVGAMTKEVAELLRDRRRWADASAAARSRAASFDWALTARQHVDVYRAVLAA